MVVNYRHIAITILKLHVCTYVVVLFTTQCQASPAIRSFIDQIFSSTHNPIMLIGADCSVGSEPVAELASSWNLIQVQSYGTAIVLLCVVYA